MTASPPPERDPKAKGTRVVCVRCRQTKAPRGRSVSMESYGSLCTDECHGFYCQPLSGDLWLGETREEFGYACSTAEELAGKGPIYGEERKDA